MINKRTFHLFILLFTASQFLNLCVAQTSGHSAINILSKGLGNENTAEEARYLIFSYNSGSQDTETSYLYDWESGDCRFEGQTADSEDIVVLFNANETGGEVFVNKKPKTDERVLKDVRQSFQDDSYFLFMPIRIAKQEISAVELEPEIVDSKKFHVLQIRTPRSKYKSSKIYVDFQNGTIYKWDTFDGGDKLSHELIISRTKDVGSGLILPTQFTDNLTGESFDYPIAAALLNIEPQKFKKP